MNEITDPLAWVASAEEDYQLAVSALRRRKPLTYGACFHAQQCAEKHLKAALVSKGQVFPKTHDLIALSEMCAQAGIFLAMSADALDLLSSYAVQARYPGAALPTPQEAREALEIGKTVRRFVRKFLGLKV